MKPTELEPNHVIYVGDNGKVLYNSDYKPIVSFEIAEPHLKYDYTGYIIEKFENGQITAHNITDLKIGDTLEMSPMKYGFAISTSDNALSLNTTQQYSFPHLKINVSDYDSSSVTDFSYMFGGCESIVGTETLNTSKGTVFDNMFEFYSGGDIAIPLDLTNLSYGSVNNPSIEDKGKKFLRFYGIFNTVSSKIIDLTKGKCQHYSFVKENSTYFALINNEKYGIKLSSYVSPKIYVDASNIDMVRLFYAGTQNCNAILYDANGNEITNINMN